MIKSVVENSAELSLYSDQWYIYQYLLHGSVEAVFCAHRWDLKISVASYHRLVKKYGIVKSAGRREASLTELLQFFVQKSLEPTLGIETVYYQKMPASFQTSLATLHRTYQNILNSNLGRTATGLIIHPFQERERILVGQEVSTKKRYGKYAGDFSIPMTFSQDGEKEEMSVLRVLQQEVFTYLAIKGQLAVPSFWKVLDFEILDVSVSLYEIDLPQNFPNELISSAKLANLQFCELDRLAQLGEFRTGVMEMIENLYCGESVISNLNKALLQIPA